MGEPAPNAGQTLSPKTTKLVNEFYMSEAITRIMPGMKYIVSLIWRVEPEFTNKSTLSCAT